MDKAKVRICERRLRLMAVRRAILRVAFFAEVVLAIGRPHYTAGSG